MKLLSINTLFFLLVTFSVAQSPYNSISYGIILDEVDASSLAQGCVGLIPSYDSRFSTLNPATWSDLKFAYLTVHYNTGEIQYPDQGFKSGFGNLVNATFIVPIKGEFAWGFGLRPYSRKRFSMEDSNDATIIFSDDTLSFSKYLEGTGGISSFFTSGSWKINKINTVGIQWDFLFGVFDEKISTLLSNQETFYRRHFEYKATLLCLFFRTAWLESYLKSTIYTGFQFPIGNRRVVETDYYMFVEPKSQPPRRLSLPTSLYGGVVYHLSNNTHLSFEVLSQLFMGNRTDILNTIAGSQGNASRISVGMLRERIPASRSFINRLHYRIGFFMREHYISRSKTNITERGIAFGFGIPFGLTQNQIDIGFRISKRDGFLSDESEIIRQVAIGVTIGDIWLVRRRGR